MADTMAKWKIPAAGMWGFSHCAFYDSWYPWSGGSFEERLATLMGDILASGSNSFRPQIHWHQVEPLLVDTVAGSEDVTDEMVQVYADGGDGIGWGPYDRLIDEMVGAGIEPHMVIGAAYDFQVPSFEAGGTFRRALPDFIGHDRYLGQVHLHARAAVRRYRDRVHMWQIENELNVAGETMLFFRWRSGRSWLDRGFQTSLMEVLSSAVRMEDRAAHTSHNFHTDLRVIRGLYDWRDDVRGWLPFIDIVGVDGYPNYLFGWPSRGGVMGKVVGEAVGVVEGRPVMVLESGYSMKPRHRGNSESRQAEFVFDAIASAARRGACGFYLYQLCSAEGYPVHGPWSNRFVQSIEPWWGLVRKDGSRRPGFFEFQRAVSVAREVCESRNT